MNIESYLTKQGQSLANHTKAPFTTNYRPETDVSPELDNTDAAYYMSLIGVAR